MSGRLALLLPGQGAQHVGMGHDLYRRFPEVRQTFRDARELLGFSLEQLCFDGPAAELQRPENCQLAIFILSLGVRQVLERHDIFPSAVAGHSAGEYAALVAASALSFRDACLTVRTRGLLMSKACKLAPGGMVAIVGLSLERGQALCSEVQNIGVAQVTNYNSPDQLVVSGEMKAIELVAQHARASGALKTTILPVDGAFHTKLMEPAREQLAALLNRIDIKTPRIPIVLNVTARPIAHPPTIRKCVVDQLTAPVRWAESIQWLLHHGITTFVEVGPGKILTSFLRSTANHKSIFAYHTSTANALDQVLKKLGGHCHGSR